MKGRDRVEDLGVDGSTIRLDLQKDGGRFWIGLIWLRIWASGGLL